MASPLPLEELWHFALVNYGLERPSVNAEIHVFRVILQTSLLDKKACTRSVTPDPMSDPVQTLEQIIEEWWDLEVETQNHSWKLTSVNGARSWSPNKDLLNPVYVLTRQGDPFHLQRPHGVVEVIWGDRSWITALALPKWINSYHCVGLLQNACGPMLPQSCAMWCDDSRLREELVECHIGSFVQVHIETVFCDLIRIDLQAALQRSMDILHLPVKTLQDDHVMMKVFVPHGVTCYSSTSYTCITQFENWQSTLIESGKRAYPGRNPETMIFHRVHSALAEVSSLFDPITNHFTLSDSDEQEYTRTVVFAVFTSSYEFFGACHWTRVTKVWDILDLCGGNKGWVVYHNNQRLGHHKVSVHHGDVFACYERNNCNTPFQADRVEHDAAKERVANALAPEPSEAVEPLASELLSSDAVGDDSHVDTATFEQTGYPLLLIGRASGQRSQGVPADVSYLSPFQ